MKSKALLLFIILASLNGLTQNPLRFGINFPLRNPETTTIPTYMNLLMQSEAQVARQLTYGDVFWRNLEPIDNQWHFENADSVFLDYPGIDYIATLYSMFNNDTVGYQVPWRACTDPGNPACRWIAARDSNDTKEYLDTVISHYGGVIRNWELGNEVENRNYPESFPVMGLVQFFNYNYRWIKNLDPTAKVVIPSFVGTFGVPMQQKYDWLRTIFSLGGGSYTDAIAYHDYNSWWTLPLHIDSILSVRNSFNLQSKPLWLTESSVSSTFTPITPLYVSPDEQAADVWRRSSLAWSKGVELYIWHSLWSSGPPSEWQEFGILNHLGQKKKSFHSYHLLTQELLDFTSAELVSHGVINDDNLSGGDGVWVVKFIVDGKNKWVMWSPDQLSYVLTANTLTEFKTCHVVPYFISPNGETALFEKDSVIVPAGTGHTFQLSSIPILVEENDITSTREDENSPKLAVWPNPADKNLWLAARNQPQSTTHLTIIDSMGRRFMHAEMGKSGVNLNTSYWPSGIYFYILRDDAGAESGKILIQH